MPRISSHSNRHRNTRAHFVLWGTKKKEICHISYPIASAAKHVSLTSQQKTMGFKDILNNGSHLHNVDIWMLSLVLKCNV